MSYREVTLPEMLACREARAQRISAALSRGHCPLVSFTMNIAGGVKNSPLIRRGFLEGCRRLERQLGEHGMPFELLDEQDSRTGCERLYAVTGDAAAVKRICAAIEDQDRLSRLFDMDVMDRDGCKIAREDMGMAERGCLVCGAPGRGCASRRVHSAAELWEETIARMTEHFLIADQDLVAELATESLVAEVNVTPKPGLVDRSNNGSHSDMDLSLFERSAASLTSYWGRCFRVGIDTAALSAEETFLKLRPLGLEAEQTMYAATGGVNTHKGAIFLMGTLCGAIGRLWDRDRPFAAVDDILDECGRMTKEIMKRELAAITAGEEGNTAGENAFRALQIRGARGEAADGFPHVRNVALPALCRGLERGLSEEYAAAVALLHLIAAVDDTNMFKRGAADGALSGKAMAQRLIENDRIPTIQEIGEMDRRFMETNLSPGGCADLLAVTLFLHRWETLRKKCNQT